MGRSKDLSVFSPNPVAPIWSAVFCAPRGDMPCPSVPIGLRSTTCLQMVHTKQIPVLEKHTSDLHGQPIVPKQQPNENELQNHQMGNCVPLSCCRKNGPSEIVAEITVFSNPPPPCETVVVGLFLLPHHLRS